MSNPVGRPPGEPTEQVWARLTVSEVNRLRVAAASQGKSLTQLVRDVLRAWLGQQNDKQ